MEQPTLFSESYTSHLSLQESAPIRNAQLRGIRDNDPSVPKYVFALCNTQHPPANSGRNFSPRKIEPDP